MHGYGGMHGCGGGHVWLQGVCMVVGGIHGCGGACMVVGRHVWLQGGHAWLWGVCMVVGVMPGGGVGGRRAWDTTRYSQ